MRLFKLAGDIVVNGKEAIADIKQVEDRAGKAANNIQKNFRKKMGTLGEYAKRGAAVAGTAFAGLAASGINEFAGFEQGMKETFTLIPDASEEMREQMTEDIQEIGEEYGYVSEKTIPALYQALSAGIPPDNVMRFMEQAARSAKAGATDLQTSVDTLTSVVNAYGREVIDSQEASDILFTTVKEGKTTFPELGASIANVTPIASNLGVAFEDVSAAIATMTKQGLESQKTTNYLRRLLQELSQKGMDAFEAFEKASGQTFPEFIESGGKLNEALQIMVNYAEESDQKLGDMFGRVQAGQAAMMLTGANMEEFNNNIDAMGESAGSTQTAFEEMAEGVQHTLDQLRAWWEKTRIDIGESLQEPLQELMTWLRNNSDEIERRLVGVFEGFVDSLKWIINNEQKVKDAIKGIGLAFMGWQIGSLVSNLWGLAAVLGVIGGLGVAKAIREIGKAMKENWGDNAIERHKENAESLKNAVADHKETLKKLEQTLKELKNQRDEYAEGKVPEWLQLEIEKIESLIDDQEKLIDRYEESKKAEQKQVEVKKEHEKANENLIRTIKNLNRSEGGWEDADAEERLEQLHSRWEELLSLRKTMLEGGATPEEVAPLTDQIESIQTQIKVLSKGEDELKDYGAAADTVETKLDQLKGATEEKTEASKEEETIQEDLYEGYQGTIGARQEEAEAIMDQLEAQSDAKDIEAEMNEQLNRAKAKQAVLGDEYELTKEKIRIYEQALIDLKAAELENTEVHDKIKESLEELREGYQDTTEGFMGFFEEYKSQLRTVKNVTVEVFDAMADESKSATDVIVDNLDEIADAGVTAATGNKGFGTLANWAVDIGKGIWNWLTGGGGGDKEKDKEEAEQTIADTIRSGIKNGLNSAFSADTYQGFIDSFGQSIEEAVKSSMIKAFMATEMMKDKMKKLSNLIAEATSPEGPGGISITESERASIRNMADKIVKRAKPLYDAINSMNLGPGETKTGTFGSAPGSSGSTTTVQTENITPDVIERLGDTVKDQGQDIVKELEKQTNLLGGKSGQTEVTLKLDKEVLARKIFELKNKRKRAMGVS